VARQARTQKKAREGGRQAPRGYRTTQTKKESKEGGEAEVVRQNGGMLRCMECTREYWDPDAHNTKPVCPDCQYAEQEGGKAEWRTPLTNGLTTNLSREPYSGPSNPSREVMICRR